MIINCINISDELDCDDEIKIAIDENYSGYIDRVDAILLVDHLVKVFKINKLGLYNEPNKHINQLNKL